MYINVFYEIYPIISTIYIIFAQCNLGFAFSLEFPFLRKSSYGLISITFYFHPQLKRVLWLVLLYLPFVYMNIRNSWFYLWIYPNLLEKKHIFQRVKELSVVTMMINESDIYICRNKFHTFANIITLLSLKNPISETFSFSRKSRTSILSEILNVYFGFSMRKMTTSLNIHKIWCLYLWTILPYCWWLFTQSYIHISLIFVTFPRTTETPYIRYLFFCGDH